MEKAVAVLSNVVPSPDEALAGARIRLAACLHTLDRTDEARTLVADAAAGLEKVKRPSRDVRQALADIRSRLGDG